MITVGIYGIPDTTHGSRPTYTHDHGIALMKNGRVLTVIQLERWTGIKHDNRLPNFITQILLQYLPPEEPVRFVSVNSFVGSTFISKDGNLRIEPQREVGLSSELVPAEVIWYPDGLHKRVAEGWVLSHEVAHLTSLLPFIGSFDDHAIGVHIDGGASRSSSSFWHFENGIPILDLASWDLLKDVVNNFNVNPGVRAILGFRSEEHLSIPGRLMGYAAHGMPDPKLETWLKKHHWLLDLDDQKAGTLLQSHLGNIHPRSKNAMDFAATLQRAFEKAIVQEITNHQSSQKVLYYAGGAALNIPTNTLLQKTFDKVWIPPGTNDSGLALGAAAWLEYLDYGKLPIHDPFLNRFDTPLEEPSISEIPRVADLLLQGKVIGICNGSAEVGPRALGHRSLLARTDDIQLRIRVSEQIKQREWYRPIAPILCEQAAQKVLEPIALQSPLSNWMLGAWKVRPEWTNALAGVIHANGTVRAQVVRSDGSNTWMEQLLTLLWEKYQIPALINTSFNGRGKPIVQRHRDALMAAHQLGLDGVVIHGSLYQS